MLQYATNLFPPLAVELAANGEYEAGLALAVTLATGLGDEGGSSR